MEVRNLNKLRIRLIIVLFFSIILFACKKEKEITIGFSYPYVDDKWGWGAIFYQEVTNELNLHFEYKINLIEKDAKNNREQQLQDLKDLYEKDVDVLLLFPMDTSYFCEIIEKFYDNNVPVVVIDRKVHTEKFTTYIGHENTNFGEEAGRYAARILNNQGSVLEIMGMRGTSTVRDRSKGFHKVIDEYPQISIDKRIYGDWLQDPVYHLVDSVLKAGYKPDLIYSHNDKMAYWASEICEKHNISPCIIGIDGLSSPGGGIELVDQGKLDVTFYNRPGGDVAVRSAFDIIEGKKVSKIQMLGTFPIDKYNVKGIQKGFELLNKQFSDIALLREQLGNLGDKFKQQQVILIISVALIILVLAFSILLYVFLRQKHKYIEHIEYQKRQISLQMEEEKVLSEKLAEKNQTLEIYKNELEHLVDERTSKLKTALRRAKESDKLKSSFLANFSHEVRTPLNSIVGFSNILLEDDFDEKDRESFLKHIIDNSRQLLKLINDLVEISIISTERITINQDEINVHNILKEIYNDYKEKNKELLSRKLGSVSFNLLLGKNGIIKTDSGRLKQLLGYLVDNAVKFTHKGTIELGCNIDNKKGVAKIYVKDSGIGIDQKNHKSIFKKFVKLEDNIKVLYRGSGIGLNIAKKLAKNLGTRIRVESKPGEGSVFYCNLPVAIDSALEDIQVPKDKSSQVINKATILIAEDEESNYLYIKAKLKQHDILRAENGKEAVEMAKSQHIDLIFMDIKMPEMNGLDAMKKIKELKPDIPIIAVTAYAHLEDKQELLECGFDDYISKPVEPKDIHKVLQAYLQT